MPEFAETTKTAISGQFDRYISNSMISHDKYPMERLLVLLLGHFKLNNTKMCILTHLFIYSISTFILLPSEPKL